MLLICWGSCRKCPTVKILIPYIPTHVKFHWNFPPDCMNKQRPSKSAFFLKLFTAQRQLQNTIVNGRNISGFIDDINLTFFFGKAENSNSPVQYPVRHLQPNNINVTSPAKTQRGTHILNIVQQYCLTLKMEATPPFETSGTASHPTRTELSAAPLTEPEITQQ